MKSPLTRQTASAILASVACLLACSAFAQGRPVGSQVSAPLSIQGVGANDSDAARTNQALREPAFINSVPAPMPPRTKVEIFKQTLPNGQVVYGDAPLAGSKIDKVIRVEVPPASQVWSAQRDVSAPAAEPKPSYLNAQLAPAQRAAKVAEAAQASAKITAEIEAAEVDFSAAELALHEGRAVKEGDRSRNINGTTRLSEVYLERQQRLQKKMDEASERLYNAYEAARTSSR